MARWQDKKKMRKFFDGYAPEQRVSAARAFLESSEGSGFSMPDPTSGIVAESAGPQAQRYSSYRERVARSRRRGTQENRLYMEDRAALWDQLMQGAGDDRGAGFYTRPDADGGTVLYWRGYDYKGRYATHPFRIASTSRANADLSYFNGNPEGEVMLNPRLRESVLRDRFDEFFELVMGRKASTAPDELEQTAIDFRDKLKDAGSIVGTAGGK